MPAAGEGKTVNPYAALSLAGFVITLALASFSYFSNRRERVNRLFAAMTASAAATAFVEFQSRVSTDAASAMFWELVDSIWPFRTIIILHFAIAFTGMLATRKGRPVIIVMYSVAALVSATYMFVTSQGGVESTPWGWVPVPAESLAAVNDLTYMFGAACSVATLGLLAFCHRRFADWRKRRQSIYIIGSVGLAVAVGVATEVVIPMFIPTGFVELSIPTFALASVLIWHAIRKYELFVLTPEKAAAEIVQTMPDALVLLDGRRNINAANPAAHGMLGYGKGEMEGRPVSELFPKESAGYAKIFGEDVDEVKDFSAEVLTKKGEKIAVSVSASTLRYDRKNVKSTVMIFRDMREREKAKQEITGKTKELEKKTAELERTNNELKRINDLAVGRELRMVELKKRIAQLEKKK